MTDDGSTAALGPTASPGRLPDTVSAPAIAAGSGASPPAVPTVTCGSCQAINPATMNFCKMCGEPLRPSQPAQAVSAVAASSPAPPSVGGPAAAAKQRNSLPSALAAVVGGPAASSPRPPQKTILAAGMPKKPAATPQPSQASGPGITPPPAASASASGSAAKPTRTCPSCSGATPIGFAFCQHCGVRIDASGPVILEDPAALSPNVATISDAGVADTLAGAADVVPLIKKRVAAAADAAWAHLVSVLRDGSDGERHPLVGDVIDIGRTDGTLLFADDRYLAPRHARVERRGASKDKSDIVVTPLDSTNGVYYRLRHGEVASLVDGDHLLLGKEVLRFEAVDPEERNMGAAMQHGVRLFGSPVRSSWGRLRQLVQSGVARDILHLASVEVTLGREEGDLRWNDDEFMSRRHARLVNRDGRVELVDLDSSNGTFVRLRGERTLRRGDAIRMGDQLFRFEPV